MKTLTAEQQAATLESLTQQAQSNRERLLKEMEALQVAVYVMCGGGFLGRSAAEQPATFYIDSRCGKLPYGNAKVMRAVQVLALHAKALGIDPNGLPNCPRFHACWVF